MVRFARAHGSKSSNERQPEEATSWLELKKTSKRSPKPVNKSITMDKDSPQVTPIEWAAFPTTSKEETASKSKEEHILTPKQRRRKIHLMNKSKPAKEIVKKEKKTKKNLLKESKVEVVPTVEVSRTAAFLGALSKRQKRNLKQSKALVKVGKRRKPPPSTSTININGIAVEVTTFDGYTVTKQDGDRLVKLRQDLIAKRVPEDEVKLALKAERRRAERTLAREKKKVCFHCRQSGHNLSECPMIGSSETDLPTSGICFKCGSTEHAHLDCRVTKGQEFRFAKCFICQEQGHISVQCPDNPRGLYPKGGGCKICSDVTHLKKDCPQLAEAKEREEVTLQMGTEF